MTTLSERLHLASIASCNCNTKTPSLEAHDRLCRYRAMSEAILCIERLTTSTEDAEAVARKALDFPRPCKCYVDTGLDEDYHLPNCKDGLCNDAVASIAKAITTYAAQMSPFDQVLKRLPKLPDGREVPWGITLMYGSDRPYSARVEGEGKVAGGNFVQKLYTGSGTTATEALDAAIRAGDGHD